MPLPFLFKYLSPSTKLELTTYKQHSKSSKGRLPGLAMTLAIPLTHEADFLSVPFGAFALPFSYKDNLHKT